MGALMLRMDDARARIEDRVPEIRRFGNAADFAAVVASNRLPTTTPVAYVLFAGLHGGKPTASAGLFIQDYDEVLTVILADRITGDPTGDKALKDVAPLVAKVVEAVCGWAPDDAAGVFVLRGAELVGAKDGQLIFQIEFTLVDQLRITP
mgnify:CR=1 FL=1